jgi:hypothetical protein
MRHHQVTRTFVEVWLADDGTLRRTRERAKTQRRESGYALRAWVTDHWDFGIPVEITRPSPDQVLDEPAGR